MLLIGSDDVEIRNDQEKGRGLFATKDIPPGTLIGDYTGQFKKTAEQLKLEEEFGMYSMDYNEEYVIFPDKEQLNSLDMPLINHSCEENCGILSYNFHAIYFAVRKIFKGEELAVSYSVSPHEEAPLSKYRCFCGSDFCRGTFCVSVGNHEVGDEFESGIEHEGEYIQTAVENEYIKKLPYYPKNIKDYDVFDIFGSTMVDPEVVESKAMLPLAEIRKKIRETGKCIYIKNIDVLIRGVRGTSIFTEYRKTGN